MYDGKTNICLIFSLCRVSWMRRIRPCNPLTRTLFWFQLYLFRSWNNILWLLGPYETSISCNKHVIYKFTKKKHPFWIIDTFNGRCLIHEKHILHSLYRISSKLDILDMIEQWKTITEPNFRNFFRNNFFNFLCLIMKRALHLLRTYSKLNGKGKFYFFLSFFI